MKNNNPRLILFILLVVISIILLMRCSGGSIDTQRAISINDYHMSVAEFEAEYAEAYVKHDAPDARKAFLESVITRKLILQEAQKIGLDKQSNFLDTIERFWEQNLLKLMVEHKTQEISGSLSVTDAEIEQAFSEFRESNQATYKTPDEIKESLRVKLLRDKQTEQINAWIKNLHSESSINIDERAIGLE